MFSELGCAMGLFPLQCRPRAHVRSKRDQAPKGNCCFFNGFALVAPCNYTTLLLNASGPLALLSGAAGDSICVVSLFLCDIVVCGAGVRT